MAMMNPFDHPVTSLLFALLVPVVRAGSDRLRRGARAARPH